MNPLTNMKNVLKLSEQELTTGNKTSWHDQYKDSAWVFVAGFSYDLTEGDLLCIFSQYGEIVHINLVRDKDSGKSRGFCFICYEDQRSTVLAVDNFNGIKLLNRFLRVDHVSNYKVPKNIRDEAEKAIPATAVEPKPIKKESVRENDEFRETLADQIESNLKLPQRLPIYPIKEERLSDSEGKSTSTVKVKKEKKQKKEKKSKKSKKSKKKKSRSSSSESDSSEDDRRKRKKY